MRRIARSIAASAVWLFVTAIHLTVSPSMGFAQPGSFVFDSVEWMAVEAPVIAAGVIESVEPASDRTVHVEFNVSEMLKGAARESLTFRVHVGHHSRPQPMLERLVECEENGTAMMVVLMQVPAVTLDSAHYEPKKWGRLRDAIFAKSDTSVFAHGDAGPSSGRLKTMDLMPIADYEQLLAATRSAVQQDGLLRPWDSVDVNLTAEGAFANTSTNLKHRVPVDERLEALAKEWLKSDDVNARVHGISIIQLFRSPENKLRLESLLAVDREKNAVIETANNVLSSWEKDDELGLPELAELLSTGLSNQRNDYQLKRACRVAAFRESGATELIPILEKLDAASELWVRRAAPETIMKISDN